MAYPATWRKLEWTDPNPDPDDVLGIDEGVVAGTDWGIYFDTELQVS